MKTSSDPADYYSTKQLNSQIKSDNVYGVITNTQVYSLHDGPGVRTLVFLKGCKLRCAWCCNPETQRPEIEVEYYKSKCTGCSKCATVCNINAINPDFMHKTGYKIDKILCNECGKCVEVCPDGALEYIGQTISVYDVMKKIKKDKYFYLSSNGGLRISGGELLYQLKFTKELLNRAYNENIDTAIETCGHAPWKDYEQIIPFLTIILFDIKHMDPDKHKQWTGVTNKLILSNLIKLSKHGVQLIIRIPLIPKFNLDKKNICETKQFLSKLENITEINLMLFHQFGRDKYRRLCRNYSLKNYLPLESNQSGMRIVEKLKNDLGSYGFKVTIGG